MPIINKFKDAWDVVKKSIDNNKENFQEFIDLMQTYVLPILKTVFGFIVDVGAKAASAIISAFGTIAGAVTPVLNFIIDSINTVIRGLNLIKPGSDIAQLSKIYGSGQVNGGYQTGQSSTMTTMPTVTPSPSVSGGGSSVSTGAGKGVSLPSSVLVMPTVGSAFNSLGTADVRGRESASVTINIGVAGDPEATARTIVDVMNNSNYRGTGGANNFVRGD